MRSAGFHHLFAALAFAIASSGCDPMANIFEPIEGAEMYEATTPTPAGDPGASVLVMTWNIKFGGGRIDFFWDCFGNRDTMNYDEVIGNLEGLAAKIRQVDPDVVLLQEVDIAAHRSADVDIMQWLLDHTRLNYGAYASHWRSQYIPSNNLQNMDSGNGVLSKWPIRNARRIALALRQDLDDLHRQFYLKRNMLTGEIAVPGHGSRSFINIHAEAYATDGTLKKHIAAFKAKADELSASGVKWVGGGDFNMVPPGTAQLTGFPDSVCNDPDFPKENFTGQEDFLASLYGSYASAIPLAEYRKDNSPWFSFTADKAGFWNRTLDHLFTNGSFVPGSALMHLDTARGGMETMPLSDHAPLTVRYAL